MKITVPFLYEALIIKPRCSKPVVILVKDLVVVELLEAITKDLPIAFKVGPAELRWDGENLWDYNYANTYQEPSRTAKIEDVIANTKDGGDTYQWSSAGAEAPFKNFWHNGVNGVKRTSNKIHWQDMKHWLKDENVVVKEDAIYREWIKDNREAVINRAKSICANLLIVDGVMYTTVSEPRYNITTFGLGNNHGGTGMFVGQSYNQNLSHESYFTALEYDSACEYADKTAKGRGDNKSIPVRPNGGHIIEVLIPQAVKLNPRKDHGNGSELLNNIEDGITAAGPIGGVVVMAQQLSQ